MTRTRKLATFGILGLAGSLVVGATFLRNGPATAGPSVRPPIAEVAPAPAPKQAPRKIQVAILLDVSGSMDGLLEQAKSQLWRIVNELAAARKQGVTATVEIALYEYGKTTIPATDGYVRRILPFTTDLDRVSEELFALTTNGGDEWCGRAIQEATRGLEWSASPDDLKLVFIAGNESFAQGDVDFRAAIGAAKEKGIIVNVIHCGSGEEEGWRDGAALAMGEYMSIDHNQRVVTVDAPQDAELARLSSEINTTYIPYGAEGEAGCERQAKQDSNAVAAAQGALVQRSISKASGVYRNASWDLVDALEDGTMDLGKVEALPENMRKMNEAERLAHVMATALKRKEIQARIGRLAVERDAYVATELARRGVEGTTTLDKAIVAAVRLQAATRGYSFGAK